MLFTELICYNNVGRLCGNDFFAVKLGNARMVGQFVFGDPGVNRGKFNIQL